MPTSADPRPPVGVVFDSDFGNRIDSILALALLYGCEGQKQARVVSVSISNQNLKAAELADIITHFYAEFRAVPIGLYAGGKWAGDSPMVTATLSMQHEGGPLFTTKIKELTDTADPATLIRNALTAQHDQNCVIVSAAPAVNLAALLRLHGARDLITAKVRYLVTTDTSKKFLGEWPTPIVIAAEELGSVLYPATSIEKDFSWSPAHPVVAAYRAYKPMPYDAETPSMAAALYAVRPDAPYFRLSEPLSGFDGKVRKLLLDPEQKEAVIKIYTELASGKPLPKPHFGPPKVEEAKPEKAAEKN